MASLVEAALAARDRSGRLRAEALGARLVLRRQQIQRDHTLESCADTLARSQAVLEHARQAGCMGTHWREPGDSLDDVLVLVEPDD